MGTQQWVPITELTEKKASRMQIKQDYYHVLGAAPSATMEEVHDAYHKLAFQSHPDRNEISLTNDQKILEINEAYDTLSDPIKRRAYDIPMGYNTTEAKFKKAAK